jgi:hypothetical protein
MQSPSDWLPLASLLFIGGLSPALHWLMCTGPPCRNVTNIGVDKIWVPAKISLIFAKL